MERLPSDVVSIPYFCRSRKICERRLCVAGKRFVCHNLLTLHVWTSAAMGTHHPDRAVRKVLRTQLCCGSFLKRSQCWMPPLWIPVPTAKKESERSKSEPNTSKLPQSRLNPRTSGSRLWRRSMDTELPWGHQFSTGIMVVPVTGHVPSQPSDDPNFWEHLRQWRDGQGEFLVGTSGETFGCCCFFVRIGNRWY